MKKLFPFFHIFLILFLAELSLISAQNKLEQRYYHEQQADHFSQEQFPLLWDQKYLMQNRNNKFINATLIIFLCAEDNAQCLYPQISSILSSNHSLIILKNREIAVKSKLPQSLMQHILDIDLFSKSVIQSNETQGEYIDPKIILAGEGIYGTIAILAQNYLNKQLAQRIVGVIGINSPLNISASNDLWKTQFCIEQQNDSQNMFKKTNTIKKDCTNSTVDSNSCQESLEQNKDFDLNQLIDEIKSHLMEMIPIKKQGKQKKLDQQKTQSQEFQKGQQQQKEKEKLSKKKQQGSNSLLNDESILLLNERSNLITQGMVENCPNVDTLKTKKNKQNKKKKGKLLKQKTCLNVEDYTIAQLTEIVQTTLDRWSQPKQTIKNKFKKNQSKKNQKNKVK